MDAAGEVTATTVLAYDGGSVTRLARYPIAQSLGIFYSLITQFLGYAFNEDEYKVMGLASFGDPQRYADFFRSAILLQPDGSVEIPCLDAERGFADGLFFTPKRRRRSNAGSGSMAQIARWSRTPMSAPRCSGASPRHCSISAAISEQTGLRDLLLSGGCAENCSAIGELRSSGMFDRIHVAYASGDEGTALGAAAAHVFAQGTPLRIPGEMPFFGPAPQIADRAPDHRADTRTLQIHEFAGPAARCSTPQPRTSRRTGSSR